MVEQENVRVALLRQESKYAWRNLLKICLAVGMTCVVALLVTVLVLHSETVGKKARQTDFYEEEGKIPYLLCTKCDAFNPSSNLTAYKEFGSVRVFNDRATGLLCCVETVDELDRLMQLVPSKLNQRRIDDQGHTRIEKPTAHLFLNVLKSAMCGSESLHTPAILELAESSGVVIPPVTTPIAIIVIVIVLCLVVLVFGVFICRKRLKNIFRRRYNQTQSMRSDGFTINNDGITVNTTTNLIVIYVSDIDDDVNDDDIDDDTEELRRQTRSMMTTHV